MSVYAIKRSSYTIKLMRSNDFTPNADPIVDPMTDLDCHSDYSDCSHIPNYELFETGDVLLYSNKTFIPSLLVEDFTHSKYSHAGMILKDPVFPNDTLKGLYILESTGYIKAKDVEDHKDKIGVQINKLSKVYDITNGDIVLYWRRLVTNRDCIGSS